jgi:iron-sulfur cluster assembly accessory protein
MIDVTQTAQTKLADYMKQNSLTAPIRVYLSQGGCSGQSLALALDELKDTDQKTEFNGMTFLIDITLAERVGGVTVDFVEEGCRSGFMVSSEKPVATGGSSCGCGCSC